MSRALWQPCRKPANLAPCSKPRPIAQEEGWILGAGHAATLLDALTVTVTLQTGLPEHLRAEAARLYWQAFGGKLGLVMGPEARAPALSGTG